MPKAKKIMKYSNASLSIIFMPKTGKLVKARGKIAQWIAQASEAATPIASQFTLKFMARR